MGWVIEVLDGDCRIHWYFHFVHYLLGCSLVFDDVRHEEGALHCIGGCISEEVGYWRLPALDWTLVCAFRGIGFMRWL